MRHRDWEEWLGLALFWGWVALLAWLGFLHGWASALLS